jgi:hypothetical protein
VKGKVGEFYKLMVDDYGMAFRITPKAEVTPKRMTAWKSLKAVADGHKTVDQHLAGEREVKLTPKLVKVLGPAATPVEREKSRERNEKEIAKSRNIKIRIAGTPSAKSRKAKDAAKPVKHAGSVKTTKTATPVVTKPAGKKAPKPAPVTDKKVQTKKPILIGKKSTSKKVAKPVTKPAPAPAPLTDKKVPKTTKPTVKTPAPTKKPVLLGKKPVLKGKKR